LAIANRKRANTNSLIESEDHKNTHPLLYSFRLRIFPSNSLQHFTVQYIQRLNSEHMIFGV
jgi:hypothetical protein